MNLTELASYTRKFIALFLGSLIIFSIIYFAIPYVKQSIVSLFPPQEKPNLAYGKLPRIKFNGLNISPSVTPTYNLNTPDGRLPNITPKLISVYRVEKPAISFFAGKNAQRNASSLQFSDSNLASSLTGSVYKWVDIAFSRQLEINISTNTLDYSVNLVNNKDKYNSGLIGFNTSAAGQAQGVLSSLGYFKDILYVQRGSQKVVMGKIVGNQILETTTPSDFTMAKVDFFRTVSRVPIVGPRYDDGLLEVILGQPKGDAGVVRNFKIRAHEWTIDLQNVGRYPPINVSAAWNKVTSGDGIFAKVKLKNGSEFEPYQPVTVSRIDIEDIELGYYDTLEYQPVMQPIYVFKGTFITPDNQSGNVVIYVPAISEEYLQ